MNAAARLRAVTPLTPRSEPIMYTVKAAITNGRRRPIRSETAPHIGAKGMSMMRSIDAIKEAAQRGIRANPTSVVGAQVVKPSIAA